MEDRIFTREELQALTNEEIVTEIGNRIYKAGIFFEALENAGIIWGNGHHLAQELSEKAIEIYRNRKKEKWE